MTTIKQLMNLRGRRALITGATGNLGKVIAESLAELGADLVLTDGPGVNFQSLAEELRQQWSIDVQHRHCDLENKESRDELISWIATRFTNINILINNAAFVGTSELKGWAVPFEDQSIETWRRALEVNLTAAFDLCKGLAAILKVSQGASIVNIASIYGEHGPDWSLYNNTNMSNPAAYGVSKGGLIQLTRWLSTTISPNVRVNTISPGGIFRNQNPIFLERYGARTPLGRMANENDFRGAIAYLASDMSRYVTGQNLAVDGGWGVW